MAHEAQLLNLFYKYLLIGGVNTVFGYCAFAFLLFFGIHLELLPVSGWDSLAGDKILPSITLGAAYALSLIHI